jgi:hypothetical protein
LDGSTVENWARDGGTVGGSGATTREKKNFAQKNSRVEAPYILLRDEADGMICEPPYELEAY